MADFAAALSSADREPSSKMDLSPIGPKTFDVRPYDPKLEKRPTS